MSERSEKLRVGKKQPQNTSKLPYFKKKLTGREQKIVDYLILYQNEGYISTRKIAQDVGFDHRSTRDLLKSLSDSMLVYKKVIRFKATKNGGKRFSYCYKINLTAIACMPIPRTQSFLTNIREKNKELFEKIFNFKLGDKKNG